MAGLRWLIVGLFLATAGRVLADPVGMACHIKGQPEFRIGSGSDWKPLPLLQRLEAGSTIRCKSGSEVTVVLFGNGNRFQIDGGQQATIQNGSVTGARSLGGLQGPSAAAVQKLGGARSGAMLARALPARRNLGVTADWITPESRLLKWDKVPAASEYRFTLYDPEDADEEILSIQQAANEIDLPDSLKLVPHRPYVWRLSARNREGITITGSQHWGVLTLLSREDAATIQSEAAELQRQAKANPQDALPLLLLSERYRSDGMLLLALETLEDAAVRNENTIDQQIEILRHLGGLGRLFAERIEKPATVAPAK